jgi:hypothetical protein
VVDILAVLRAETSDFTAKMAAARAEMDETEKAGGSSFSKLASVGKAALLGIAGAAAIVGVAAVKMGSDQEDAQAGLQASLKAAGISWNSVKDSVAKTGAEVTKYGFTQTQVDQALQAGVISTQSYTQAHKNLAVAVDLAAARHISLTAAMQAVDKAAQGNVRVLKQMGIDLPVVTTSALKLVQAHQAVALAQDKVNELMQQFPGAADPASKSYDKYETAAQAVWVAQVKLNEQQGASSQILDALTQRLGGQAAAAADTFAGRLDAMRAQGENLLATIGIKLIPVLERLMTITMNVANWFDKHRTAAIALGAVIGGVLVAAMGAYAVSLVTVTTAEGLALAPFVPIIAAVAALVAAIIFLAVNWSKVWSDIKNWTNDAYVFIQSKWYLIMAIPIVGWIIALGTHWQDVWNGIQTVVQTVWGIIKPIFDAIKSAFDDVTHAIGDVTGAIGKIGSGAGGVVNTVLGFLAEGGPAQANKPYIVGENGPELFIPSSSGVVAPNSVLTQATTPGSSMTTGPSATAAGGTVNNFVFNGVNFEDAQANMDKVGWAIRTAPAAS